MQLTADDDMAKGDSKGITVLMCANDIRFLVENK